MSNLSRSDWDQSGESKMTAAQQRMFNAVCGDLAKGLSWHGNRLVKDDWRHMISGTMLGWRMMPGINLGTDAQGFIMLGGSSLSLTRTQAVAAINIGLDIGDHPEDQGLNAKPVQWSDAVLWGLGFNPEELRA